MITKYAGIMPDRCFAYVPHWFLQIPYEMGLISPFKNEKN